jgi:SAM-dependent methyltransferase
MRRHDWSGFAALGATVIALAELGRGNSTSAVAWFLLAVATAVLTRYWSIAYPAPMPHLLRWTLAVPRGNHSPEHVKRILEPRRGERILEIGPGTGIHAIPVAAALAPDGMLDVLDVQQAMLDDVMDRARATGVTNITAKQGDARRLPYTDASFDGAYLVGVLGEIPDGNATLRELRRVLKPQGRLVIGEVFFDPDFVRFGALERRAAEASFAFERRFGGALTYLARFRPIPVLVVAAVLCGCIPYPLQETPRLTGQVADAVTKQPVVEPASRRVPILPREPYVLDVPLTPAPTSPVP